MPDYYGVVDDDDRSDVNRRDLVFLAIVLGAVIVGVVLYLIL